MILKCVIISLALISFYENSYAKDGQIDISSVEKKKNETSANQTQGVLSYNNVRIIGVKSHKLNDKMTNNVPELRYRRAENNIHNDIYFSSTTSNEISDVRYKTFHATTTANVLVKPTVVDESTLSDNSEQLNISYVGIPITTMSSFLKTENETETTVLDTSTILSSTTATKSGANTTPNALISSSQSAVSKISVSTQMNSQVSEAHLSDTGISKSNITVPTSLSPDSVVNNFRTGSSDMPGDILTTTLISSPENIITTLIDSGTQGHTASSEIENTTKMPRSNGLQTALIVDFDGASTKETESYTDFSRQENTKSLVTTSITSGAIVGDEIALPKSTILASESNLENITSAYINSNSAGFTTENYTVPPVTNTTIFNSVSSVSVSSVTHVKHSSQNTTVFSLLSSRTLYQPEKNESVTSLPDPEVYISTSESANRTDIFTTINVMNTTSKAVNDSAKNIGSSSSSDGINTTQPNVQSSEHVLMKSLKTQTETVNPETLVPQTTSETLTTLEPEPEPEPEPTDTSTSIATQITDINVPGIIDTRPTTTESETILVSNSTAQPETTVKQISSPGLNIAIEEENITIPDATEEPYITGQHITYAFPDTTAKLDSNSEVDTTAKHDTTAESDILTKSHSSAAQDDPAIPHTTEISDTTNKYHTTTEPHTTAKPNITAKPATTAITLTIADPDTSAKSNITTKPYTTSKAKISAGPETAAIPHTIPEPHTTSKPNTTAWLHTVEKSNIPAKPDTITIHHNTAEPDTTAIHHTTAEPDTTALHHTTAEPDTTAIHYTTAETDTTAIHHTTAEPDTTAIHHTTAEPDTTAIHHTTAEPDTTAIHHTTAEPDTTALHHTTAEPDTTAIHYTTAEPDTTALHHTTAEPDTTAIHYTTAEPDTTAIHHTTADTVTTAIHHTTAEPDTTGIHHTTAEPDTTAILHTVAEPDNTSEPETSLKTDTTPKSGTTTEPETTAEPDRTTDPDITAEPEATPEPETTAEPESKAEPETSFGPHGNVSVYPEPESEMNSFAEPGPDWDIAKHEWKEAWHFHIYFFGALFSLLGLYCFISVIRLWSMDHLLSRHYFLTLNILVIFICVFRAIYLLVDAYNSNDTFPVIFDYFMYSTVFPCITAVFSILFYALLLATRLRVLSPKVQKLWVLTGIIVLHFIISITTDVLVGVFSTASVLLFVCQLFFVLWGLAMFVGYIIIFKKLYTVAVNRQKAMKLSSKEKKINGSLVTFQEKAPKQRYTISLAVKVTLVSAVFGLAIIVSEMYSMFGVYGIMHDNKPDPWPWWAYHTVDRTLEVLMCACIAYVAAQPFKYTSKKRKKTWHLYSPYRMPCCCHEGKDSVDGEFNSFSMDHYVVSESDHLHWRKKHQNPYQPSCKAPNPPHAAEKYTDSNATLLVRKFKPSMLVVEDGFVRIKRQDEIIPMQYQSDYYPGASGLGGSGLSVNMNSGAVSPPHSSKSSVDVGVGTDSDGVTNEGFSQEDFKGRTSIDLHDSDRNGGFRNDRAGSVISETNSLEVFRPLSMIDLAASMESELEKAFHSSFVDNLDLISHNSLPTSLERQSSNSNEVLNEDMYERVAQGESENTYDPYSYLESPSFSSDSADNHLAQSDMKLLPTPVRRTKSVDAKVHARTKLFEKNRYHSVSDIDSLNQEDLEDAVMKELVNK